MSSLLIDKKILGTICKTMIIFTSLLYFHVAFAVNNESPNRYVYYKTYIGKLYKYLNKEDAIIVDKHKYHLCKNVNILTKTQKSYIRSFRIDLKAATKIKLFVTDRMCVGKIIIIEFGE